MHELTANSLKFKKNIYSFSGLGGGGHSLPSSMSALSRLSQKRLLLAFSFVFLFAFPVAWLMVLRWVGIDKGNAASRTTLERSRPSPVAEEQRRLALMNSLSTWPLERVFNRSDGIQATFKSSSQGRASVHRGTEYFLAYAVDLVLSGGGESSPIVPPTGLRKLTKDDLRDDHSSLQSLVHKVVALALRPGGTFSEPVGGVCNGRYECRENAQYDPLMDEEICVVKLKTRKGGFGIVPLEQLDHLFILDFVLFGSTVMKRSSCSFAPDRLRENRYSLVADGFDGCCDCSARVDDAYSQLDRDRVCKLSSASAARLKQLSDDSSRKTLGRAFEELILMNPSLRQVAIHLDEACVKAFSRAMDARVQALIQVLRDECPDREELASDYDDSSPRSDGI